MQEGKNKRSNQFLFSCFPDSSHIGKINVSRHSRAQSIVVSGQADLYAKHLFDPVRDGLHIARGKFGLPVYLLDHPIEILARKRIDTHANMLAYLD